MSRLKSTVDYCNDTADKYDDMHGDQNAEHTRALDLLEVGSKTQKAPASKPAGGNFKGLFWERRNSMSRLKSTVDYYNDTADKYDDMHGDQNAEHTRALDLLVPRYFPEVKTMLDVGTGTGRTLKWFSDRGGVEMTGLEPSPKLAEIARAKVPAAKVVGGSGDKLPFEDGEFDLVTITGVLHHVEKPKEVLAEMFRVSRLGVLISDHNNFAFGSDRVRKIKMCLFSLGLLSAFSFVKQGFKKQGYSTGDGWWYPYSVLNDFDVIAKHSNHFALVPTRTANSKQGNFMLSNSHVAIACLK